MTISLSDTGKRFNRDWIFRHFTYTFESGQSYAITGPNGSGKSTLLQVLSGSMLKSEGEVKWMKDKRDLHDENVFSHISLCAPYLELIEEMTLAEFLQFHSHFKSFLPGITVEKIISIIGLEKARDRQIRYFSSGMKQRAKLAQCIFSDTGIVLLDEPCTNLDLPGIDLYQKLIRDYCSSRLVVVSSNDSVEYGFCNEKIEMSSLK